ncbi:MAG: hypothetical protein A3H45_10530 [Ignavibacteria bacterium RIFCSPLOWO2_02_FULL_55_14]|nr:MAG: hypothetical protein A3H45_10530 [Ignavibacteria bacterium RIFCSPLOWO2_02_FULL_55_14]
MKTKILTKRAMVLTSVRLPVADSQMLKAAASKEQISQSEFLRLAIRERSRHVLLPNNSGNG